MTKVEELRENLVKTLTDAWGGHNAAAITMANDIISAAHAEGVAEGAEQERKANIWRAERCSFQCTFGTCPLVPKIGQEIVPLSAVFLAPTKEVAG